jgi:membrane protein DedA with SNARE-associated domain
MGNHAQWLLQHGYSALFVALLAGILGVPVPDETLLTVAGYLAHKGQFQLLPTILAGFLGSASGISISYAMGRGAGGIAVRRLGPFFHLDEEKLARIRGWFEHHGRWMLVFGYFVPGVRHLTAIVAGSSRLPFPLFAIFAYTGALIWSLSFICIGYFLEQGRREAVTVFQRHRWEATVITGAVLVVFALIRLACRQGKRV